MLCLVLLLRLLKGYGPSRRTLSHLYFFFDALRHLYNLLYEYKLTCPTLMNALYNSYTCLTLFIGIIIYGNSCKHTIKMLPFHQTTANRQVGKQIKWSINHRFMHLHARVMTNLKVRSPSLLLSFNFMISCQITSRSRG